MVTVKGALKGTLIVTLIESLKVGLLYPYTMTPYLVTDS